MGYTRKEKRRDKKLKARRERIRLNNHKRRLRGAKDRNARRRWLVSMFGKRGLRHG